MPNLKSLSSLMHHVVVGCSAIVLAFCTVTTTQAGDEPPYFPRVGALTDDEMQMAKVAWKYFQNNTQANTGLANAVDGYPSTTMWDTASYIAAMMAAYELGMIDKVEFDKRMSTLLKTLLGLDFFQKELPNKVYNTKTAAKVNYVNKPGEIGFSALDLGRLLIWLKIIKERYPEYGNTIDQFVLRWDFRNILDQCGTMYGAMFNKDKKVIYVQEGRLGYEEYSAKGFQLWGFSTCLASRPEPYEMIPLYGVDVPYDSRDPRVLVQHNYVVSESYVLDGIEFDWDMANDRTSNRWLASDTVAKNFAKRIYQAQENRYKATGILTARSEHQLDQAPYFVYDTIFTDGFAWNTITESGKKVPEFSAIALKAALGLWVLWDSPYTDLLAKAIWNQYVPEKGYYEGVYENGKGPIKTFTANNNGIMLETLLYKAQGKLLKFSDVGPMYKKQQPSMWDRTILNVFDATNKRYARPVITPDNPDMIGNAASNFLGKGLFFKIAPSSNKSCPQLSPAFPPNSPSEKCPTCSPCQVCRDGQPVVLPAWSSYR
jgi:hypothetical protein